MHSKQKTPATPLIGHSEKTKRLMQQIIQVATSKAPLMIWGELGSGKRCVAKLVHEQSKREGACLIVNCISLTEKTIEPTLCGHGTTSGVFQQAYQGSLVFHEIGMLTPACQQILADLLTQYMCAKNACRLIATSRQSKVDLYTTSLIAALQARFSVLQIEVPPLRERSTDLHQFFPYMTRKLCLDLALPEPDWIDDDILFFEDYAWPGNVQEVINFIERCLLLNRSPQDYWSELLHLNQPSLPAFSNMVISVANPEYVPRLQQFESQTEAKYPIHWGLKDIERQHVERVIKHFEGNKSAAARQLGISRKTLDRKLLSWLEEGRG